MIFDHNVTIAQVKLIVYLLVNNLIHYALSYVANSSNRSLQLQEQHTYASTSVSLKDHHYGWKVKELRQQLIVTIKLLRIYVRGVLNVHNHNYHALLIIKSHQMHRN